MKRFSLLLVAILSFTTGFSQISLSGHVWDQTDGSALPGAYVIDLTNQHRVETDSMGLFQLTVQAPNDSIMICFPGFEQRIYPAHAGPRFRIFLPVRPMVLDTIEVVGLRDYSRVQKPLKCNLGEKLPLQIILPKAPKIVSPK